VQTELRFDFTLEGAVITTNITNHFLFDGFENAGDNAVTYQPGRADQLDSSPVKLSGSAPKYPVNAAKEGVRGKVHVRFYIDMNGDVRMPAIASAGEHPYLAEQAVFAIRQWKFAPPTCKGRPVLVAAAQEFDFGDAR
jgi:TonB family protein